jgi:large subunit ribosomal protein L47
MNSLFATSARRVVSSLPRFGQRAPTNNVVAQSSPSIQNSWSTSIFTARNNLPIRSFTSTNTVFSSPLDQFRDSVDRQTRASEPVGRSWRAKELRRKSYDDLHKLWYVLYKEKNMLLTEQQLSKRRQLIFPQPDRLRKVRKSMGAIKQVLGERKRQAIAEHAARMESEMLTEVEEE